MIIGDKIATSNLSYDGRPTVVEVTAIEKHEIVWTHVWIIPNTDGGRRYLAHVHVDSWIDKRAVRMVGIGRVQKRDRGITWCPAWIEREIELLTVTTALRSDRET